MADTPEVLPALKDSLSYELEQFTPIREEDSDRNTTVSDLQLLNNHLSMCNAALPNVRTLAGLCVLSNTVCKLIETRRKVKKLSYGEPTASRSTQRAFEILE